MPPNLAVFRETDWSEAIPVRDPTAMLDVVRTWQMIEAWLAAREAWAIEAGEALPELVSLLDDDIL